MLAKQKEGEVFQPESERKRYAQNLRSISGKGNVGRDGKQWKGDRDRMMH